MTYTPAIAPLGPSRSGAARRHRLAVVAREPATSYRTTVPLDTPAATATHRPPTVDSPAGTAIRSQIRDLQARVRDLQAAVDDPAGTGGELGALVDLARMADSVQAVMLALTARIEAELLAQRRSGLPLDELLGLQTRLTSAERRGLLRTASALERMPHLAAAVRAGLVGAGETRAVLAEVRRLDADGRAVVDALFADQVELARHAVDEVVDEVTSAAVALDPRSADRDRIKAYERRYLAITPGLAGTLAGYFEFDDESGALVLRALEDASVPLSGPKALTRDATLPSDQVDPDGRTLGRRRADALVVLAEHWLGSHATGEEKGHDARSKAGHDDLTTPPRASVRGEGSRGRAARPLLYVLTDIATLTGEADAPARLLWDALGPVPVLTAGAARRLASDARLQFLLTDGREILGISAPVDTISAKLRAAVHARDVHCRFPGCRVPSRRTDLHHVVPRHRGGHTVVTNLVALCRRHHTAVGEGGWRLTMSGDGVVTVRRGRHRATSHPPAFRSLEPAA
jgi:hypothetical protein